MHMQRLLSSYWSTHVCSRKKLSCPQIESSCRHHPVASALSELFSPVVLNREEQGTTHSSREQKKWDQIVSSFMRTLHQFKRPWDFSMDFTRDSFSGETFAWSSIMCSAASFARVSPLVSALPFSSTLEDVREPSWPPLRFPLLLPVPLLPINWAAQAHTPYNALKLLASVASMTPE